MARDDIQTEGASALAVGGEHELKARQMELTAGLLGRLFGGPKNAPTNIAGFVVVLLLITGLGLLFTYPGSMTASEYWKVATPIITLIVGYVFGKKT